MKCQSCGVNDVTVHLTEITDEGKVEKHLCDDCARHLEISTIQKSMNILGILQHLLQQKAAQEVPGAAELSCPSCGMSYLEFRSSLRLGCPNDYEVFKPGLMPLLERIQDGPRHCGKVPSRAGRDIQRQNELIRLRRELERAVQREDYETAARLRDCIRKAEQEPADAQ